MNVVEANVLSIVPQPDYEVYNAIQSFLESAGVESNNTRVTYETAIKDFFKVTLVLFDSTPADSKNDWIALYTS